MSNASAQSYEQLLGRIAKQKIRCCLLLPMFRLCLLVTTLSPRTAEPVEMSLGVWTRVCQGTMYWVGARIPAGEGAIFGASPGSL